MDEQLSGWLSSSFRRVLNVVSILLGISPASEVYKPTFRNSVSVPSSCASRNNTGLLVGGKYTGTEIRERANEEVGLIWGRRSGSGWE